MLFISCRKAITSLSVCVCITLSQACEDGITPAVRSVKFYGVVYDRDILAATGEVEKASAQV